MKRVSRVDLFPPVKFVKWNHSEKKGVKEHLITLNWGQTILATLKEMTEAGLARILKE